jgi:hypothetical protein
VIIIKVEEEYTRIKDLFEGTDEKQLSLLDGTIWEAARLRVELDRLNDIVKITGLVKIHKDNPTMQKELPISRLITKVRANYLNYVAKLSNILGKNIDEEDDDLTDYE